MNCIVCDAVIDVEEDDLDEGEIVVCDECGAQQRVVGKDPLELEEIDEDEEDDEGYDDEDDEDDDWR